MAYKIKVYYVYYIYRDIYYYIHMFDFDTVYLTATRDVKYATHFGSREAAKAEIANINLPTLDIVEVDLLIQ